MAFEVKGKVSLDGSGFQRTMKGLRNHATSELGGIKSAIAGAFTIGAVVNFANHVNEVVGRIKDLSEQFRVSTDEVQQVDFATKQSGLAFEDFGAALDKLAQSRRSAVEGNEELRTTFEKYGLTLKDLNDPQLRNIDLAQKMAANLATMTLTSREQSEVADLLGRKSSKLLAVLQELGEVKPPGLISEDSIERIDKASKAMEALKMTVTGLATDAISEFADYFDYVIPRWLGGTGKGEAEASAAALPVFRKEIEEANAKKRARLEQEEAERKAGLFEVDKDKNEKKAKTPKAEKPQFEYQRAEAVNSLARIGGFVGNAGEHQESRAFQRTTIKELQEVNRTLKELPQKTAYALEGD